MKKYRESLYSEMDAEEILDAYFMIKSKPFLDAEDMRNIKAMMPRMYELGIDVNELNIGSWKKDRQSVVPKYKNPKRVTPFNRKRI